MMNISGPNNNSNPSTSDGKARSTLSINKGYWNLIPGGRVQFVKAINQGRRIARASNSQQTGNRWRRSC